MKPKNGSKSPTAYEHYLQTGTITGYHEGAKIQGPGVPPENPMGAELFDKTAANIQKPTSQNKNDPWSDELVRKVMWSNPKIVDKSIEEGWICGLYDFIRDRHRLPQRHEWDKLRHNAAFVRESAAGREDLGQFHGGLVKLAQMMMERRNKLAEEFTQ